MPDVSRCHAWHTEEAHERLDVFLKSKLPGLSRNALQKLITAGCVRLNCSVVHKPSAAIPSTACIELTIPAQPLYPQAENRPLQIIFEDPHLLVVNKPPGMSVHPVHSLHRGTFVASLLAHTHRLSDVSGPLRPGIVHRLDKDTSGVLVVAKTNVVHMALATQFQKRGVEKHYRALTRGIPTQMEGCINTSIKRNPHHRTKMSIVGASGRMALTAYRVLNTWKSWCMLDVRPLTGRTHQIRVHLGSIGCFVLGDPLYGGKQSAEFPIMVPRLMLHAFSLGFFHPVTRQWQKYTTPIPDDMQSIIDYLESEDAA